MSETELNERLKKIEGVLEEMDKKIERLLSQTSRPIFPDD